MKAEDLPPVSQNRVIPALASSSIYSSSAVRPRMSSKLRLQRNALQSSRVAGADPSSTGHTRSGLRAFSACIRQDLRLLAKI